MAEDETEKSEKPEAGGKLKLWSVQKLGLEPSVFAAKIVANGLIIEALTEIYIRGSEWIQGEKYPKELRLIVRVISGVCVVVYALSAMIRHAREMNPLKDPREFEDDK